jgi:glycosyltransferase involved in cell wall biosynthesis
VACRSIKLNNVQGVVPERIKELESKTFPGGADVIIQNLLPHYMEFSGKFKKNIGLYLVETSNFISSTWANHINLMDEGWVPCKHNKIASRESKVKIPLKVVPTAVNVEKYKNPPNPLPLRNDFKGDFIFYTVGEFTRRKNLHTLLKAFHTEFHRDEPVQLLIKTTPTGLKNPQQDIQKFLNDVKVNLKIYPNISDYKQELIIFEHLSEENLNAVHISGDCFVTASHGESICLPAIDAMGFGRPVIAPNHSGFTDYLEDDVNACLVPSHEDIVYAATDSFVDIYTGRESWGCVTVNDLREAMRFMYEYREDREMYAANAKEDVFNKFNYSCVGQKLKEALSD